MDIHLYERNQQSVIERFQEGDFDYVEVVSEAAETEFFRYISAEDILFDIASSYPSPCKKQEEVPRWWYMSSDMSMRLHGVHSYNAYPYVIRGGGLINAFGPEIGHKVTHPQTGDVTLACKGFNDKNYYDRQTPCDQDYLRKYAKRTDADALMQWHNEDVVRVYKKNKAFDPQGIFIGDASYIFVPDNPKYERSSRLFFDEQDHPVSKERREKMTRAQLQRCQWKRCYKMVSLIHTDWEGSFFLCAAVSVLPGRASECPVLYKLVDTFVAAVGEGVMKRLILDRGFIDAEAIGKCKKRYGIDVLIPLRVDMDLYKDAMELVQAPETGIKFMTYMAPEREQVKYPGPAEKPEPIRKREAKRQKKIREKKAAAPQPSPDKVLVKSEVAGIPGFQWDLCSDLPLNVIVNRETYADGHEKIWMLLDTKPLARRKDAVERRTEYGLRTAIEERHRQLKCFWDLARFTSTAFSLVVHQIVFVLLTYSLFQLFLLRKERKELNRRTRNRVLDYLRPQDSFIIIYCEDLFAILTVFQYTRLLLTLSEEARVKVLKKTQRLERELDETSCNFRPP